MTDPSGKVQAISPAQSLARYMILSQLGHSCTGQVYAAYDPQLDRRVALKLLHSQPRAHHRKRLVEEAKALARLSHPHVVTVHDVDEVDGRPLITMEFVEGQSLGDWQREHPVGSGDNRTLMALELLIQAGQGLAAAHAEGLVHRNFKPSNVLVGSDDRVRVTDFGPSPSADKKAREAATQTRRQADRSPLTPTDPALGTSPYMAPEQFTGAPVDARADQFAFCITAWEVLFGVPYPGENINERVAAVGVDARRRDDGTLVPKRVEQALRKGLAGQASTRHHDVQALLDELQAGAETLRGRSTPRERWRGWRYLAAAAMLTVGALGANRWNVARVTQACAAEGDAINEVWNDSRRATLVAALARTKIGSEMDIGIAVTPWIDTQAASWRTHMREACMTAKARETWTQPEVDKVLWCLEDDLLELAAVVEGLVQVDDDSVQYATESAAGLTRIEICLDAESIASVVVPPRGEHAAYTAVRAQSARVAAYVAKGEYEAGLALAGGTRESAERLGWVPLVAQARVQESFLYVETGDYRHAEALARAAFLEASQVGAWRIAASAATHLTYVVGVVLDRHAEGLIWSQLASMSISHAGDPFGLREATLASELGLLYRAKGRPMRAIDLHQRALLTEEKVYGRWHPYVAATHNNMGQAYTDAGEHDRALESLGRALSIQKEVFGSQHPHTAVTYNNRLSEHFSG